ncbi:MAG: hypothetical protein JXB06_00380 [Spirochaetales bacterium]|nr:hypothetical protein [Spirochaetales bacterium]
MIEVDERIEKHRLFWQRTNSKPLVGFSIGDYFVSRRFRAAETFLSSPRKIEPEMLDVPAFEADYRRMAEEAAAVPQDVFFTATPFTGIPWMEGMLGCPIYSRESSFIAKSPGLPLEELDLEKLFDRRWLDKYLEFTRMLAGLDIELLPVGQPIMRGPTDVLGTLVGQSEMVIQFFEHPKRMKELLDQTVDVFLAVIREQKTLIPPFLRGCSIGFYDLWCPGDCIWFQDDLNALLSPDLYRRHVLPAHRRLAQASPYNLFHLHPASFFIVDSIMEIQELKLIEMNKDEGGPSVEQMLPVFQKVQSGKNCMVWGSFTRADLQLLQKELDPAGLYIMIAVESGEEARDLISLFA